MIRWARNSSAALVLGSVLACAGARSAAPAATATVVLDRKPTGAALGPGFVGFSYEKSRLSTPLFDARNTALVALYRRLGRGVLRLGGNSVDRTTWDPSGAGITPGTIAPPDLDRLAGFLRATGWQVLYGLNLATSTGARMADEAAYAAGRLGDALYGFEIGNEPDLYHSNGLRPATYAYEDFRAEWEAFAAALRERVPGAALTGPGSAHAGAIGYTLPFAADETGRIALLTQHYYRASGRSRASIDLLLAPDAHRTAMLQDLRAAVRADGIPRGYRLAEANSFFHGGAPGVSDAFGSALWAIDLLFESAAHGASGVNFHGGGRAWYTPLVDDGTRVVEVRPEYDGILLFSMAASGALVEAHVSGGRNLSAYAVAGADGSLAVVLVNRSREAIADVTVELGAGYARATLTTLTGPSLESKTGALLQGAAVAPDGTWSPLPAEPVPVSGDALRLRLAGASAVLVRAR